MAMGMSVQSEHEWFVVSERRLSRKCLKCLINGEVHSQQIPIEGTVPSLSWGHLLGEE